MNDRIVREIPGYGSSLRKQLKTVGWSQARLASISRVSRQTISRAINQDCVSARTEERIAAALAGASQAGEIPGSGRTRSDSETRRSPIRNSALCDATDLEAWARRRHAQDLLPRLVLRLVLATGGSSISKASFRTSEGVQLSGWDGIVEATEGTAFIPEGLSGWEMGVGSRPSSKAAEDIGNRAKNPGPFDSGIMTFTFVTARRWSGKEEWAKRETGEGPWRRVGVIDADDLAAWLGEAPAVHWWFSKKIGKTPPGAVDLKSYWEEWAGATRPRTTSQLLLSGREQEVATIREHLGETGQTFAIRAESMDEAVAVLYCAISEPHSDVAEQLIARALVVDSRESFRQLTASPTTLLLVPTFEAEGLVSAAERAGHAVVVPLDRTVEPLGDNVVKLPPLSRRASAEALESMGIPAPTTYRTAGLARRSLKAFRRRIASGPGFGQPEWSKPGVARLLLPAVLAGSWDEANSKDRLVLATLGRGKYEDVREQLVKWTDGADPALRRRGSAWYLVSSEDAWHLLRRYMMHDDIDRFEQAVVNVLGLGNSVEHSALLTNGLAATLLVMGVYGDDMSSAGYSAQRVSERVVRQLLSAANQDWTLWASLSRHLPLLAEAAPDHFLDGVEAGLNGPTPVLARLFPQGQEVTFGGLPHTGLLWALETLAWSAEYLGRVVPLLARLDEIDPGSKRRATKNRGTRVRNRPLACLEDIFRSWQPQTAATLESRLMALDRLRARHGDVAWAVMCSMLPEWHAVGFPATRPRVRNWADDAGHVVSLNEIAKTTKEVVERLRTDVGLNATRWMELIDRLPMLPPDEHTSILDDLGDPGTEALDGPSKDAIWEALRLIVARHRTYREAKWAMPEEYVSRLAAVLDLFAPTDPLVRYGWLFGHSPRFPDGTGELDTPKDVWKARLRAERLNAVTSIVREHGVGGIERLAQAVEQPFEVGYTLARVNSVVQGTSELLRRHLADPERALADLAFGFARGRTEECGDDWILDALKRTELKLSPDQRAELLLLLSPEPDVWRLAEDCDEATYLAYWRRIRVHVVDYEYLSEGALALVNAGRPFAAVRLLAFGHQHEARLPVSVTAEVLHAAAACNDEVKPYHNFAFLAGFLLDALAEAQFDQIRLAELEWALLPLVGRFDRPPNALHGLLAESPSFFCELVDLVHPAETEDSRDLTPADRLRVNTASSVLRTWRTVPGQDGAKVDGDRLRKWITSADRTLLQHGLLEVGRYCIGEMLSDSPFDPDGTWPSAPVREVIEKLESPHLEQGIQLGVYGSRGVVSKDPEEGGAQERVLAERYEGLATAVSAAHPCTGQLLRKIAARYRQEAQREDFQSEMRQDLGST